MFRFLRLRGLRFVSAVAPLTAVLTTPTLLYADWGAHVHSSSAPSPAGQGPAPQQPPPAQRPIPPSGGQLSRPPIRFVLPRRVYLCVGEVQVVTLLEPNAVRLTLNGQVYNLKQVESVGSATKYAANSVVWSSVGENWTLEDDADAANPQTLAKECRLQSTFPVPLPVNSIQGTVSFRLPKDLPPAAELRIQLVDLNPTDEQHKSISVQFFNILGRKPPIAFELKFDPKDIRSNDCCALGGQILVDGKPRFVTAKPQPIADLSRPVPVDLALVPLHNHPQPPSASDQPRPQR